MRVAGTQGADDRSVNEVMGFIWRLATMSSAHLTDYVVDAGTVALVGGARTEVLIRQCKRVKLLTQLRVDGMVAYKIVEDPDFLHLRLKAEIEWEAQQRADRANPALAVPVRHRDGDQCRYCTVMVMWQGRPSKRSATLDHLEPGSPATIETLVVACRSCNSGLRDIEGLERDVPKPPPANPYYSKFTADFLTDEGRPTEPSAPRPDIPSGHAKATRKGKTSTAQQRPDSQSDNAPEQRPGVTDNALSSDLDAATAASGQRDQKVDLKLGSAPHSEAFGTDKRGTGRDGSGLSPPLSQPTPAGSRPQQRQRSRRGRRGRGPRP